MQEPKIKILYVSHDNHLIMGAQNSMSNLIENLDRSKFTPYCLMPSPGELSEKLERLGCNCYYVTLPTIKPKNYSQIPKTVRYIRNIIKTEKFDFIHPDFEADVFLCGLAKLGTSCKMVWHVRLTTKYAKDLIHQRLADGFIGISEGTKQRFARSIINSDKFRVIFNGVDCSQFTPPDSIKAARQKLRLPDDRFILLFTGQIKPGKGIYDLANALAILKNDGKQIPYTVFVGWAPNNNELLHLKQLISGNQLDGDVMIMPRQKNIYEWMQAADVLTLPSHDQVEGMGRVLFEAMACGAAVIGTDTSGLREAITKETGLLVPEKSPASLAQAIEKLMCNTDLLDSMKMEARKRAVDIFDIRLHARKVEDFYYHLLGTK
jgi:glycosyltransferase involved in cell wall biosynthesis